jgi:excisionase family DNA binding protein
MPSDRRSAPLRSGNSSMPSAQNPAKSIGRAFNRCGDCLYLHVAPYLPGDPPDYWCGNPATKELVPAIGRVGGPEAVGCKFFIQIDMMRNNGAVAALRGQSLGNIFLTNPDRFIDVLTAAHRLRTSDKTVYRLIAEGQLESLRIRGRIYVYFPSIVEYLSGQSAAD